VLDLRKAAVTCAAALVAGCASGHGAEIADHVRAANSPIVEAVTVSPINPWGGKHSDDIYVYLSAKVTDAEVQALWCDVVVPARPERLGNGRVVFAIGVTRLASGSLSGGRYVFAEELPACP
jgi:hypothetical protein